MSSLRVDRVCLSAHYRANNQRDRRYGTPVLTSTWQHCYTQATKLVILETFPQANLLVCIEKTKPKTQRQFSMHRVK